MMLLLVVGIGVTAGYYLWDFQDIENPTRVSTPYQDPPKNVRSGLVNGAAGDSLYEAWDFKDLSQIEKELLACFSDIETQNLSFFLKDMVSDHVLEINGDLEISSTGLNRLFVLIGSVKYSNKLERELSELKIGSDDLGQESCISNAISKPDLESLREIQIAALHPNGFDYQFGLTNLLDKVQPGWSDTIAQQLKISLSSKVTARELARPLRVLYNSSYLSPEKSEEALELVSEAEDPMMTEYDLHYGEVASISSCFKSDQGRRKFFHKGLFYFKSKVFVIAIIIDLQEEDQLRKVRKDLGNMYRLLAKYSNASVSYSERDQS